MRTAIIGNSHTIAVQNAFENRFKGSTHGVSFAIFHAWRIENAKLEDGRLGVLHGVYDHKTPCSIDLDDFDQYVICGGGWWAGRNAHLVPTGNSHPLAHMSCVKWDKGHTRKPAHVRLTSESLFVEVTRAWLREMETTKLMHYIGANSSRRIIFQPWPGPNRCMKHDPDWLLNQWYGDFGPIAWREFFQTQRQAFVELAQELNSRNIVLDYPLAEAREDGFMDASLCDADPFHGNPEYGNLVVDQILPFLAPETA